jgi:DNA (cytosine-5)-methyltransferase 1
MKFIDLFAGLGGFHVALSELGHECVFACEIENFLRDHYEKNFKIYPEGDITKLNINNIPKHEILCAGFPCQPFSKAGNGKGFNHKIAGKMFFYITKIIKKHKPKFLFLENVPNLINHNNGKTWKFIKHKLKKLNYDVDYKIISPVDFDIPQSRDRVYIVGKKDKLNGFKWPMKLKKTKDLKKFLISKPTKIRKTTPLRKNILDTWKYFLKKIPRKCYLPNPLWAMEFGATYPFEKTTPHAVGVSKLRKCNGKFGINLKKLTKDQIFSNIPSYARLKVKKFPRWKVRMIMNSREFYKNNKTFINGVLKKIINLKHESYQKLEWNCRGEEYNFRKKIISFRGSGVRIKRNGQAPTLIASCITQTPYLPWKKRYISFEECLKIQGFTKLKSYPNTHEKFQFTIGNAVNVKVVSKIASNLFKR